MNKLNILNDYNDDKSSINDIPNIPYEDDYDDDDDDLFEIPSFNSNRMRNESLDEMLTKNGTDKTFTQYIVEKGNYIPMQQTVTHLKAGYYKPITDHYNNKIFAQPKSIVLPKLYELPNDLHKEVMEDITKFWESEDRYKQFGNVYKRNILLYSIPGNGKTSLINILAHELIEKYDGVVISIEDEENLTTYPKLLQMIRQIEPNRKILTVIEDFERLIEKDFLSALLLQILDGSSQFSGVVTIATTNKIEKIGDQYTSRPSRFNRVIEYKKPDAKVRKFYITKKLTDAGIEIDDKVAADIDRYVIKTKGYSFDFVKEVVQGIYVEGISEDEVFERINTAIKKKGKYEITEDKPKKVGFGGDD